MSDAGRLQVALADIGRRAVQGGDLSVILDDAVRCVAKELRVERVTVLEFGRDGERVRLRAGVGWNEGALGAEVEHEPGSFIAYVLGTDEAVIVSDLLAETRFRLPSVLLRGDVRSALAVRIPGAVAGSAFGVIGVHTLEPREWAEEEVAFLRGVASVLAAAIARQRQAIEVNDTVLQKLAIAHYALERGDGELARSSIDAALERARELVTGLLGTGDDAHSPLPGDLRRHV